MQEQTTEEILSNARQQINDVEENNDNDDDTPVGIFKTAVLYAIDSHSRLISTIKNLIIKQDDQQQNLCKF